MELFKNINNLNKEKNEYLTNYLNELKRFPYIYLWGISESCDEAINLFTKNNIVIKGIIEQNPDKYDYKYKDISVIKQSFDNIDCNGAIVITCSYYETIKDKLLVNYKDIEIRTTLKMEAEVQATSVNGFAKGKIINNTENVQNFRIIVITRIYIFCLFSTSCVDTFFISANI